MKDKRKKEIIRDLLDILAYSGIIILALLGFVAEIYIAKIVLCIVVGIEVGLLALNWILIALSPIFLRAEIGLKTLKRNGGLRTANLLITLIFKVPIILFLIFFNAYVEALMLIGTLFFEEHRVIMIERSFFVLKNSK